jgi:hypothetical protein
LTVGDLTSTEDFRETAEADVGSEVMDHLERVMGSNQIHDFGSATFSGVLAPEDLGG